VIRDTVLTAVIAGLLAAILLTAVQAVWITPLILQAEAYEEAGEEAAGHSAEHAADAHHHHEESEWKPQNGWQRFGFTLGANLLMGVGYGLVMVALFLLWRAPGSAAWGMAYGIAGFCVFFLAPGLGLPPELPGTAAAELSTRQEWWLMTAGATAAGLILLFSRVPLWVRAIAIALLIAPHLIPAPHPAVEASLAPEALQSRFRIATGAGNALFWLSLGATAAAAFRKFGLAAVVNSQRVRP
jgi:cobalt transporter subunit CbtA